MSSTTLVMWSRRRPGVADDDDGRRVSRARRSVRISHAANAGGGLGAGLGIEPIEFALHLQGQFAGWAMISAIGAPSSVKRSASPSSVGAIAMPKATVLPEPSGRKRGDRGRRLHRR